MFNALILTMLTTGSSHPKFAPAHGKTLVFAGQDLASIADYKRSCPLTPYGFTTYTSLKELEGLDRSADNGGGEMWAYRIAEENPNCAFQVGLYLVGDLDNVNLGLRDGKIDELGRRLAQLGRKIFLRIGYECDYPENRYDPGAFRIAFRHIVDRLRNVHQSNIVFVWHSFAQPNETPPEKWYPGDDYVDWCAISYFTPHLIEQDQMALFAKQHHKPLMIAESSPWYIPAKDKWSNWFVPMFEYVEKFDVAAISFINCNWDEIPIFRTEHWGDCRLSVSKELLSSWNMAISAPRFINAH